MPFPSKPTIKVHGLGLVVVLCLSGVVLAQLPTIELEQRNGESEASHQARVRAAERARLKAAEGRSIVERRRGESEASLQARVRAAERARLAAAEGRSVVERRRGESEASYQARIRAADRARAAAAHRSDKSLSPSLLEKQPEADAAYQIRLRRTIQGLLGLLLPEIKIDWRRGESDASYDARWRAASRARAVQLHHLIARPGEDQGPYQNRLQTWRKAQSIPRGTHRPRTTDPDEDSPTESDPREESLAPQP